MQTHCNEENVSERHSTDNVSLSAVPRERSVMEVRDLSQLTVGGASDTCHTMCTA